MPKRTTKPTTTTSTEPLVCNLCGPNAYPGKHCPNCLAYQKAHYYRGYGVDSPGSADFFCVADSPHSIIISRQTDEHVGWCFDIEKSVRQMFDELRKIKRYAPYYGRYTYATRCTNDWLTKPSGKVIQCCSPLLMEEIVRLAKPDKPILIFAMGGEVLKAFKIKVQKYGSVQGKLLETEVMGRKVLIYPTLSKRQLATKTGYYDVLRAHMNNFLDIVWQLNEGLNVDPHITIEELTKDYRFPSTLKEVDALVDEVLAYALPGKDPKTHAISLDTETNTLFAHRAQLKILSLTVAWDKGKAASIPIEHPDTPWTLEEVRPALKRLFLSSKPKIFHNGKFDLKILARKGFIVENVRWDTMCAEHLLFEDKKKFYGLKEIVAAYFPKYAGYEDKIHDILHHTERQLDEMEKKQAKEETTKKPKESRAKKKLRRDKGYSDIALDTLNKYGAIDADLTRQLAMRQLQMFEDEDQQLRKARQQLWAKPQFRAIAAPGTPDPQPLMTLMRGRVMPLTKILADMELTGIRVDRDYAEDLSIQMGTTMLNARIAINQMVPKALNEEFNPSSPQQLRAILFGTGYTNPETGEQVCYKGKEKEIGVEYTATQLESTNAKLLRSLVTQRGCALSRQILLYRAMEKAKNTFIANTLALSEEDGRLHTNFHITGTATGRLCVSENTVLDTDKGHFVISQLDLTKVQNVRIITHKRRWRRIKQVFYKGREEMYRVELENGDQIEVTKNHRFFTPEGLSSLQKLAEGSLVLTGRSKNTAPSWGVGPRRRDLCRAVLTATTEHVSVPGAGSHTKDNNQLYGTLPREVCRAASRKKALYLLPGITRKYPRKKRRASTTITYRGTGTNRLRVQYPSNCSKAENERMVCSKEHTAAWASSYSLTRRASLQNGRLGFSISGKIRTVLTRNFESGSQFLQRPSHVLFEAVRSAHTGSRASLVHKGPVQNLPRTSRKRYGTKRPYLLELKQARATSLNSPLGRQDTAHPTSRTLQELHHRLRVSPHQSTGGSRWVIPRAQGYKETRSHQTNRVNPNGLSHLALHYPASRNATSAGHRQNTFGTCRIKKITPIGIKAVWDIEVEEDHSYIAQGFVNHNSSSDENMQNIPEKISVKVNIRGKDEDVVHNIKKVFSVTDPGNQLFVNADAKAAEVRIYAAYSKDKNLIQALNDGMDPHSYFASMIYKVSNLLAGVPPALHRETLELIGIDDTHAWSYEDFQSSKVFLGDKRKGIIGTDPWYGAQLEKLRKNIKRVVFGILYGATPNKISSIVGITEEQSQVIIATLDRMFPTIKEYVTLTKQQVQTLGVVETYFGRRRRLYVRNLPFNLRNKAERQGVNFKIQSTSSEIVLGVLCAIDEVLRHDLSGQLLLTVHDSVCFELPKKYAAQAVDLIEDYGVKRVGKMYPWLPVPFKWDVTAGPSYGEQTAIEGTPVKDVVEDPDAFIEQEIKNELADVG